MISSRVGVGAKYTAAFKDSNGEFLMGSETYKITLPADVPANLFWSITAYDAKYGGRAEQRPGLPLHWRPR